MYKVKIEYSIVDAEFEARIYVKLPSCSRTENKLKSDYICPQVSLCGERLAENWGHLVDGWRESSGSIFQAATVADLRSLVDSYCQYIKKTLHQLYLDRQAMADCLPPDVDMEIDPSWPIDEPSEAEEAEQFRQFFKHQVIDAWKYRLKVGDLVGWRNPVYPDAMRSDRIKEIEHHPKDGKCCIVWRSDLSWTITKYADLFEVEARELPEN